MCYNFPVVDTVGQNEIQNRQKSKFSSVFNLVLVAMRFGVYYALVGGQGGRGGTASLCRLQPPFIT
jgi:hypothetical protein